MLLKTLSHKAIKAALLQDWQEAIEYNLEILDHQPFHIPTLNRLAKAYYEANKPDKAIETYKQVLEADRFNEIARKNLQLLQSNNHQACCHDSHMDTHFIDEPGITKTVPLIRLGDPTVLASLRPGQVVSLVIKSHLICVETSNQDHIGALTDDTAYYLRSFLSAGNQYHAIIKSSTHKSISIFIRETYRVEQFKDIPSFANI